MAYKESFGSNVDYAYGRGVNDIASNLQRGLSGLSNSGSGIAALAKQARQARGKIKDLTKDLGDLQAQQNLATSVFQWMRLQNQIESTRKSITGLKKDMRQMPFDVLQKGLGSVIKGLINLNASILTIGFDFLITSIKRVYELQERWTKAIGGFNLRIGGMTKGLAGAQRAAVAWSSTIRGLTDGDITEGIQMFGDFTDAIGRVVENGDQFERFGIRLARGFNLGGQGAGQLAKVFQNIGNSGDEAAETIKAMIKGANAAHVPTNLLAKDILDSSVYMSRFGKEGQKAFVTGAAWVRKYTISMEQLKSSVEGLDMFDEAARTASRLNVAFGTMINSMDLMMEDDPAKRLESIRQQFLAQGMTFDKLTPKQRRYLSETLKLTEDQTAALLSAQNAGESYQDFQEKVAAKEKRELDGKRMMELQLRKTAQTMYAFGAAFDRITVAIANAIKPLLIVLGLASDGDKKFTSFGQVMESVTKTVESFFNSLAKNNKWNSFMRELAKDLQRAGRGLRDFVMDGRAADLMGRIAQGMKTFYTAVRDFALAAAPAFKPLMDVFLWLSKNLKELIMLWGGLKVFNMVGGAAGIGKATGGGGLAGALLPSSRGGMGGMGARAAGGAALGAGAGSLLGGTGSMVGGLVGGLMGPVGGIVGAAVGKLIEVGIDHFFPKKKDRLELAREELARHQERLASATKMLGDRTTLMQTQQGHTDRRRKEADRAFDELRSRRTKLEQHDVSLLIERASQLSNFRSKNEQVTAALDSLRRGVKPTNEQLTALLNVSKDYDAKLKDLRNTSQQLADIQRSDAQFRKLEMDAKQLELNAQQKGIEIDKLRQDREITLQNAQEALGFGDVSRSDVVKRRSIVGHGLHRGFGPENEERRQQFLSLKKEQDDKIARAELDKIALTKKLEQSKFDLAQKQFYIFARQSFLSGDEFLQFMEKQKASGRSRGELEQEFLRGKLLTDTSLDATSRAGIMGLSKFARGGVVTRPTIGLIGEAGPEAVIPLNRTNFAGGSSSGGGNQQIVTQIADIQLDGQKVGRALVRTHITGRN